MSDPLPASRIQSLSARWNPRPGAFRIAVSCCCLATLVHASFTMAAQSATVVPFELIKNQIVVPVAIAERDSLFMLLDTGVVPSVVDLATAQELGLRVDMSEAGAAEGTGSEVVSIFRAELRDVDLGGLALSPFDAVAMDLVPLAERLGHPLHGILGYSFLAGRVVQIDYPDRTLRLLDTPSELSGVPSDSASAKGPSPSSLTTPAPSQPERGAERSSPATTIASDGTKNRLTLPLEFVPDDIIPRIEGLRVNGQPIAVSLDTGSSLTLELYPTAVADLGLDAVLAAADSGSIAGARGKASVRSAEIDRMELGPFTLASPRVTFSSKDEPRHHRMGNLGNGFLRHFALTLDYRDGFITLERKGDRMISASDLNSRIDAIAADALRKGPLAGLSIAVQRGSDLVVSQGYGYADLHGRIPSTGDTAYDIASVTKLLTAAAVMRRVETGDLSLDDTLQELLPGFPNEEQATRIRLRHLLNHTSGLADYEEADSERWLRDGTPITDAFVLEFLHDRPLEFEPGTRWAYSNSGYYLLGMILERDTGLAFRRYLRDEVALPLGLDDTFPCEEPRIPERRSRGYEVDDGKLVEGRLWELPNLMADGGLCSTVNDLVRLPGALRSGGVVSSGTLDRMLRPTPVGSISVEYGLGVRTGRLMGRPVWGHTGGMHTFWAALAHYPDDETTIAVLVNTDLADIGAVTIQGEVARAVFEVDSPELEDLPMTAEQLDIYRGVYERGARRIEFAVSGSQLTRRVLGSDRPPRALLHQGDHEFARPEYPIDRHVFHVVVDDAGQPRAVGFSEYYDGMFAEYAHRVEE